MGNMRNLLVVIAMLVCSSNGLGRCACQCASNVRSQRSNSSSMCVSLCDTGPPVGCTYTGVYGILDGVWDVISSETTGCDSHCCFGDNVVIEDRFVGGYGYYGNFTTLTHTSCAGRLVADLVPWPEFNAPLQAFSISVSGSLLSSIIYISYDESSGKGTVMHSSGASQKLKCISGSCLQNVNLYTGTSSSSSGSTKKVVGYALYFIVLIFIAPKGY